MRAIDAIRKRYRYFRPKVFKIIDNGEHNTFCISHNNHIIGKSSITIRKGSDNRIKIAAHGKFNALTIDIDGNNNTVNIADNVKFSGHLLIVGDNLHIDIGKSTTAIDCYVLARDRSVQIGQDCMISRQVEIRATDVHKVIDIQTNQRLNCATHDVIIGHHVWIAAGVTVSKNVCIAEGCIVAKRAFVNKSVNAKNVLIGGTPARIIKTGVRWER